MALQETVRSLRAYLFVAAALQSVSSIPILFHPGASPVAYLVGGFGAGFAFAYLYLGLRLPALLASAPGRITAVLFGGAAYQIFLFVVFATLTGIQPADIGRLAIGLLIIWYLIANVRRLAATTGAPVPVKP